MKKDQEARPEDINKSRNLPDDLLKNALRTRLGSGRTPEHYHRLVELEKRLNMPGGHYHREIRVAAYFKAVERGFEPGHELDDWLEAEREYEYLIAILNSR